ncbi:PREDICTED: chymotrypsin-2-like [Dinoponera quadriceps]|uniref:Chymotrypsin-2-like n=1 Tax=Dinoponera quadriceps TaxID=609295 RepID=A0A6P3WWD1_DINQU|nr:PREDICTED: chymotrypsin-2-like [Dinoponera quadriceps]
MMQLAYILIAFAVVGIHADEPERLVNAVNTSIDKYPFAVSISKQGHHNCGGAIINKRFILTAAHCVEPYKDKPIMNEMKVLSGTTTLNSGGVLYDIEDMYYHEKYDPQNVGYDIGLIKLAKDIEFNDVQKPVPLPSCDAPIPQGKRVSIVAWGRLFHRGPVSNNLQILNTFYMTYSECQKYHTQKIPAIEFCTFIAPSLGTCNGDSGSAVICDGKIIGVVSAGRPCATGVPDIKTDICSHMDWIQNTMMN